ncbi:MAG: hypothetical protein HOP10_03185 [Chitinophagaceae bacterium]|nr:hypothetical protein [Chitinophagaceae bacterium]
MKKLLWLLPLTIGLYACPFESSIPMEAKPVEPVDSSLVGYWYGIIKDFSDMYGIEALDITKQSDSVYAITRYGKAIKGDIILPDTAYFTGYTSYIGEQRYMNIEGFILLVTHRRNKPPLIQKEKVYYMASLKLSHDTLTVKTITEGFSTRKQFKSSDELKQLVTDMVSQNKNIYDDQYSLSYRKIKKPQPVKTIPSGN